METPLSWLHFALLSFCRDSKEAVFSLGFIRNERSKKCLPDLSNGETLSLTKCHLDQVPRKRSVSGIVTFKHADFFFSALN